MPFYINNIPFYILKSLNMSNIFDSTICQFTYYASKYMDSILSILLMSVGSMCAASFYVPIKKVKGWSWESYWIVQGLFSWIIVPVLFTWITVPSGTFGSIIGSAPATAKWWAIFYGVLWGVGGLTFGLSMRYLGVALGQSIALEQYLGHHPEGMERIRQEDSNSAGDRYSCTGFVDVCYKVVMLI
jgi:hypothetical protein